MSLTRKLDLLYQTTRWLKPVQIYARAWHKFVRPAPAASVTPALRAVRGAWMEPAHRRPSLVGPMRLRALNVERELRTPADWDDPAQPKLWRNNAHYFDDLCALGADARTAWQAEYLERWLAENPPTEGTGWDSYPVSLRIVNWIKWSLGGHRLEPRFLGSLAVQARWMARRVEWHLLGNHLFVNAKALVFAGCFFAGDEAAAWRAQGLSIFDAQLDEQILPDGGQFERTPMYHALALEDVLDLLNLAAVYEGTLPAAMIARLGDAARRMRRCSEIMSHPDGELPLFNDTAAGIAPSQAELWAYCDRLGVAAAGELAAVEQLPDSGYVSASAGPARLFADVGLVGPDYLPGHAHADTLSFELSLWGERWLVNSGCSEYGTAPERVRQRGTAAHNTVVVDGEDSSEVWSGFRVARRARPLGVSLRTVGEVIELASAHDGYRRLPGRVTHRRVWRLDAEALCIDDLLTGQYTTAEAHLHLHPEVEVLESSATGARLMRGGRTLTVAVEHAALSVQPCTWHPEFGLVVPNRRLVIAARASTFRTRLAFGS